QPRLAPRVVSVPGVHVRAADADRLDLQHHLAGDEGGAGQLAQLGFVGGGVDEGFHGGPEGVVATMAARSASTMRSTSRAVLTKGGARTSVSPGARVSRPRSNAAACASAPRRPGASAYGASSTPAASPMLRIATTPGASASACTAASKWGASAAARA